MSKRFIAFLVVVTISTFCISQVIFSKIKKSSDLKIRAEANKTLDFLRSQEKRPSVFKPLNIEKQEVQQPVRKFDINVFAIASPWPEVFTNENFVYPDKSIETREKACKDGLIYWFNRHVANQIPANSELGLLKIGQLLLIEPTQHNLMDYSKKLRFEKMGNMI